MVLRFGEPPGTQEEAEPAGVQLKAVPGPSASGAPPEKDFSIAAVRGKGEEGCVGRGGVAPTLHDSADNGQQLAGRIRAENERGELRGTLAALLELHQGLRETQAQVLQLQQQLAAQQAGMLRAVQRDRRHDGGHG